MNKQIICNKSNVDTLLEIITNVNSIYNDSYWLLSDVELIPIFHEDYSGIGSKEQYYPAYSFQLEIEKSKIVIMSFNELKKLIKDTKTISFGLLFCFSNKTRIENDFHPMVGDEIKKLPINTNSLCEICIFEETFLDIYIK